MVNEVLIETAIKQLSKAYAPYSGFHVGVALLSSDGFIYTGNNIENAAYSATVCAERTAFFKAISEGKKSFKAIAICGGQNGQISDYCAPCGVCRQVMREFCTSDFQIILARSKTDYHLYTLDQLLPVSFGPEQLNSSE